jgi:hypothetical protein
MTVYNQDEFDSSFDKLDKGTYGVKDKEGKIRSVTVNEDDDLDQTSKGEPKLLRKSTGISKGKDISKSKIRK